MRLERCALVVMFALALGCGGPREITARPGQTWAVYHGDRKVLTAKNEPGPLHSTVTLPPGTEPPRHPFLTATAHYALDEGRMQKALEQAADFEDFLRRVQADGFTVEPED